MKCTYYAKDFRKMQAFCFDYLFELRKPNVHTLLKLSALSARWKLPCLEFARLKRAGEALPSISENRRLWRRARPPRPVSRLMVVSSRRVDNSLMASLTLMPETFGEVGASMTTRLLLRLLPPTLSPS